MSPKSVRRILVITITVSVVGAVVFLVLHGLFVPSEEQGLNPMLWGFLASLMLLMACILPWMIFDNNTLTIYPNSALISRATGKIDQVVKEKLIVWRKSYKRLGLMIIPLKRETTLISMEVSPITPNPKVRKIRYTVEVTGIFDDTNKLQLFLNKMWESGIKLWSEWQKTLTNIVEYQLYELNNANSNELAEFFNPRDESQQARFQKTIAKFLNPTLQKVGLEVKSASFQLG